MTLIDILPTQLFSMINIPHLMPNQGEKKTFYLNSARLHILLCEMSKYQESASEVIGMALDKLHEDSDTTHASRKDIDDLLARLLTKDDMDPIKISCAEFIRDMIIEHDEKMKEAMEKNLNDEFARRQAMVNENWMASSRELCQALNRLGIDIGIDRSGKYYIGKLLGILLVINISRLFCLAEYGFNFGIG